MIRADLLKAFHNAFTEEPTVLQARPRFVREVHHRFSPPIVMPSVSHVSVFGQELPSLYAYFQVLLHYFFQQQFFSISCEKFMYLGHKFQLVGKA